MYGLTIGVLPLVDADSWTWYRGVVERYSEPIWMGPLRAGSAEAFGDAATVLRQFEKAIRDGENESDKAVVI